MYAEEEKGPSLFKFILYKARERPLPLLNHPTKLSSKSLKLVVVVWKMETKKCIE